MLKALYQFYNLCMSHHETAHFQHGLQLTSLARLCENKAATKTLDNQTCCVLNACLQGINIMNSEHAMQIDTNLCFCLGQCRFYCAYALHSCSSHTLWGVSFVVELQQTICAQKLVLACKTKIIPARDPEQSWGPGGY